MKLVNEVRRKVNERRQPQHQMPLKKPLHFRDLEHEARKYCAHRIAQADLKAVAVLIHKPSLPDPEKFAQGQNLYHYAVQLLIERVSWYCRDHQRKDDAGDGSVELVFSARQATDYDILRRHLRYLDAYRAECDFNADSEIIRPSQLMSYSPGKRMGLQLADAVATSFYYAVEDSDFGFTEDAFARLLRPCLYRHEGVLWGYGVKVAPNQAAEKRRQGGVLPGWEP